MRKNAVAIFLTLVLIALFTSKARGQATWGTIRGYATDPSGAAVPGAKVTVTNESTAVQTKAVTDATGVYIITHLDPGEYTVSVVGEGFKRFTQEHVVLRVDSTVDVDPKMELGAVSQEITVTGAPPALETEKTDVAAVIPERSITELPLPNHNVTQLYLTVPGVLANFWEIPTVENPSEFANTTVNGQWYGNMEYTLDGVSDVAYGFSGFQIIVPPQDSVQEMKVTTADYDPEFGSAAGMVAQYVTKSGTNDLHGDVYWYNRNKFSFAADPFTEKIAGTGPEGKGTGPAPFNQNEGGFSLGGPIKKNKMFIFGDYRLLRRVQGSTVISTVPNHAFRIGDFSGLATTNPVFDPTTGNPDGTARTQIMASSDPQSPNYNAACTKPTGCLNMIPTSRMDPAALKVIALIPLPDLNQNTDDNYVGSGSSPFSNDEIDGRYDWNISDKDKVFVRTSWMRSYQNNPALFGTVAGGPSLGGLSAQTSATRNWQAALNFTHTFSSSLLTEFRVGLTAFHLLGLQSDLNLDTSTQVGIPGINGVGPFSGGLVNLHIWGPVGIGGAAGGASGGFYVGPYGAVPRLDRNATYEFINNWTKIIGRHEFRWGTDIRRTRENFFGNNTRGDMDFYQTNTASADVDGSGLGWASFELGLPSDYSRFPLTTIPHERTTRASLYWQDVWRVTPKLTANYGLRWDYYQPVESNGKGGLANFNLDTGFIDVSGYGNNDKYDGVKPRYDNFAPRLGLAYKLTQKTVLRAGVGRGFWLSGYSSVFAELTSGYPIEQTQSLSQINLYQPVFPLDQGPPAPPAVVIPSNGQIVPPAGVGLYVRSPIYKTPSVDSWNLTVERQLAHNLTLSVGYVGNEGRHMPYGLNDNAAPPGPGDLLTRRPYYQKFGLGQGIGEVATLDSSNYNGLEIVVAKHFSNGYSVNSTYTWAKALDHELTGGEWSDQATNPFDRKGSYGVSSYDRADAWILTHIWQLPYGNGLRYGSNATGIKKALLGGWEFNGFTTVETGFHFSPVLSDNSTLNADFSQRPDRVPGVPYYPAHKSATLWYNPAAFAAPPACCIWGNAGRGTLVGPGFSGADWAFFKEFTFKTPLNRERTSLQFRWENFNFFNKANLGLPNNATDSSTAGVITGLESPGTQFGYAPMRRMQFGLRLLW